MSKGKVIQRIIELKDRFSPNLNKIQKGTLQFKRDVRDLKKVGASAFKGIAVGLAATGAAAIGAGVGFTAIANKVAGAGDRIDKLSQQLGMSRQAFQEWDYILGQNGVSIDQMGSGMKNFSQQLYGLQTGAANSSKLFKRLGLDSSVAAKSQEEAFKDVVSAFQDMEEGAAKAELAQKLFGRNGQDMLPMLNASKGSVEELSEKYGKLGSAMSDEAIDNSVKFKDSLDDLKLGIKGAFQSLATPALPHFNKGIQWLVDKIPSVKKIAKDAFDSMKQAIEENREKIDAIKGVFFDVKNGIVGAFGSDGEGGGALHWFIDTGIPSVVGGVASVLSGISNTYNFFKDNWSLMAPIIYGIVGALTAYHVITKSIIIAKYAWTAAQWGLNAAMNANPIGLIVMGIGALIAAGVFLMKNWDDVKLAGQKTWNGIVGVVEWGVNSYIDYINFLIDNALKGINFLIDKINNVPGLDIGSVSFDGFGNLDFGAAKFNTEGKEFQMGNGKGSLATAGESFEDVLAGYEKKREVKIQAEQASNDNLIASLDENTNTLKGTAGRVNDIHVTLYAADMEPEEIASKLVPKIKKELFGT